jgi:hypothetical protein
VTDTSPENGFVYTFVECGKNAVAHKEGQHKLKEAFL